jgi:hypothetical protein
LTIKSGNLLGDPRWTLLVGAGKPRPSQSFYAASRGGETPPLRFAISA